MAEIACRLIFLILAGRADRYVHIGAQVAVLHVPVASAQVTQDLAQFGHISGGFFGAANIGAADNLHQRHARAVQVHKGHVRVHVMDRLARILLQMDALDPHQTRDTGAHLDQNLALTPQWDDRAG